MRLLDVAAQPYLLGQGVELRWVIPAAQLAANPKWRVRAMRGLVNFPEDAQEGVLVAASENAEPLIDDKGNAHFLCLDAPLRGGTIYYYSLFPFTDGATDFRVDRRNRTSTTATERYGLAERLYELFPAIYHRYDTLRPPANSDVPSHLREAGQLRRFLEITGAQYDQFYSLIRSLSHLHNLERVDGRLLSLLGDWIGWEFDSRQRIDTQRNELRFAPHIYQTIGIVPTIEATVKRVIGWEGRVKEYVHNIFVTNAPEQLILRALTREGTSDWTGAEEPVSIDAAYGGPLTVTASIASQRWLFYETQRAGRWEIWHKRFEGGKWAASQLTKRGEMDYRHPSAATWQGKLFVFWDVYDRKSGGWRIEFRTGDGAGQWDGATAFAVSAADTLSRSSPAVVVDSANNHLWLFWRERQSPQEAWRVRFARFSIGDELKPPTAVTMGNLGMDAQNLFPVIRTSGGGSQLWLFWARPETAKPHLWEIALRTKATLDPNVDDWQTIETVPKPVSNTISDREPNVIVTSTGAFELFWSSTQGGSRSIWRAVRSGATWSSRTQLTDSPFSQRNPSAFMVGATTVLLYRDNEGLPHTSSVYSATKTLDLRYSGSTTADTRNRAKQDLWGRFEDFQTYLYDSGNQGPRGPQNRYARDTIAIFLTPNTVDPTLINRGRDLIESALRQFLPIQVRIVLIIEPASYSEVVYSYSFGLQRPPWIGEDAPYSPQFIREKVIDQIPEQLPRVRDASVDSVPGWVWIRTWRSGVPAPVIVDTSVIPIDTHFRTLHTGLVEG